MAGTRLAVPLVLLLGLAPPLQGPETLARDQVNGPLGVQLDSQLTRFTDYDFSLTVLVVREGQLLLLKGYGLADVEQGILNTAATRFEMNSMTKMFTGAAILQLAAQGRLRLSDPIARYLDGFPPMKQRATIEQLAMHTAGLIPAGIDLAEDSREAFVRDAARLPLESEPGQRYRYSNAGFSLWRRWSRSWAESRTKSTCAAMCSSRPRFEPRDSARRCHRVTRTLLMVMWAPRPRSSRVPPTLTCGGTKGAGGVWTTVGDMYRWVVALEAGRVLPKAQLRLLVTAPRPPAEEAFGWHVHTVDGRQRADKGGGSDDFASQLLYWPRERVVIVWASNNLRQRWRRTLNETLSGVVFGKNPVSLPPVVPISQATLQSRTHVYLAGQDTLDLGSRTGYLYAAANELGVPANVMFFPQIPITSRHLTPRPDH
jgi:CubicO group peptidase (beta-lactamase class C family)